MLDTKEQYLKSREWAEVKPGLWQLKPKKYAWRAYKILKLDDAYDVARHCDMNNPFCFPVDTDAWDY